MRRPVPALAVPTLAVVLTATLLGCSGPGGDEGRAAPVGTVVDLSTSSVAGRLVTVQTPDGRIDFTVSAPLDDLPAHDETYDRPADDASFVGVAWTWDFTGGFAAMRAPQGERVEPHVWLVADGREYSLDEATLVRNDEDAVADAEDTPFEFSGSAYVAVEGEPDDLAVKVDFDGLEQVVEVGDVTVVHEGPAADLYGPPDSLARSEVRCGPPRSTPSAAAAGNDLSHCLLQVARVPWAPGHGWVTSQDDRWLVLETSLWPDGVAEIAGRDGCSGSTETTDFRYRLGDAEPVEARPADPADGSAPLGRDHVVFDSSADDGEVLTVTAVQRFEAADAACPDIRVTWSIEV
ncbi:hypothetical protein [Nocardioides sp. 1609]|uniref:hypothetical protein n=1 Tax=Nocardioides sp. 1609 TaxID=2508327 RepID=UPI00106F5CD6|nr:hypothetical protein [Nocardioides sp. 1609]